MTPFVMGSVVPLTIATERPVLLQKQNADEEKPFQGKIKEVDSEKKTIKVEDRMIQVVKTTKLLKAGKEITLADITVGDDVRGKMKENDDGTFEAVLIIVGPQPL